MSFNNIHDYALKVRRELLWEKWAELNPDVAAGNISQQIVLTSPEIAKEVQTLRASTIVEWSLDDASGSEGEGLQGCSCGCW